MKIEVKRKSSLKSEDFSDSKSSQKSPKSHSKPKNPQFSYVTAHARQRFITRFGLRFHRDVLTGPHLNAFIRDLFKKGVDSDFHFRMDVGRYNILCIKHKGKIRFRDYGDIRFVYRVEDGRNMILTTWSTKRWSDS